jgi:hypothetical protein
MSTTTIEKTSLPATLDARLLARILEEGYGPGAWHGPDLKAALVDVSEPLAFWRPSPKRHNIAEIAMHHAYQVRSVRGRLSGTTPEAFVMEGDDWFALPAKPSLSWTEIQAVLAGQQQQLSALVADLAAGRIESALSDAEGFELALGLTCHAVYHAGQVQLLKRLHG